MTIGTETARRYFPGIDGLRAVAVIGVILFHLNGIAPSGFVGVDVFFVISGFVVAHSAQAIATGSTRSFFLKFYARRLTRIYPVLIVSLVLSAVVSTLVVPRVWLSGSNAAVGLGAFAGIGNIVLISLSDGYWSDRSDYNPFTHTWSLGVEEQFYAIFPALYLVWLRGKRRISLASIIGLSLLSLAALFTSRSSTVAFYSIHTRFWELASGVLLAMTVRSWAQAVAGLRAVSANALSLAVSVGLAASFWIVPSASFPSPWLLLPVASSAVAIALLVAAPQSWLSRVMSQRVMEYIGTRSYSLYLWYWPVFVYARWTTGLDSAGELIVCSALTMILAALSYEWVEQPVRLAPAIRARSSGMIVVASLGVIAVSAGATAVIFKTQRWVSLSVTKDQATWSPTAQVIPGARCEVRSQIEMIEQGQVVTSSVDNCVGAERTLFALGDSHAWAYSRLLGTLSQSEGWTTSLLTKAGCEFAGLRIPMRADAPECYAYALSALEWVTARAKPGDILFLPGLRVARLSTQAGVEAEAPASDATIRAAIDEAVSVLSPLARRGVQIVFELPKPVFRSSPFRCSDWFNRANPACAAGFSESRASQEIRRATAAKALRSTASRIPNASVWDPFPVLCPGINCSAVENGAPVFFDGDHLSGYGNAMLWPDFKRRLIQRAPVN